jgi:Xaa-Pro dipeptidase
MMRATSGAIAAATQKLGSSGGGGPQFGPNTAFPHGSQVQRTLTAGDAVLVDGGCSVEGYRSDITRTVVFGKPSDKQRRVWDVVRKAQRARGPAGRDLRIGRCRRRARSSMTRGYGPA